MADIFMRHTIRGLEPSDDAAQEVLAKLPFGADVRVAVTRPRNIKHHRLFYALMNLVFRNQERYASLDQLVAAFKICAGHTEAIVLPSGTVVQIPRSIAFDKMDQVEFGEFYDRTIHIIAEHFLPGVASEDLRAEIEEMIA